MDQPLKKYELYPIKEKPLTLVALSDLCLYGITKEYCTDGGYSNLISSEVTEILNSKDILFANLECPITDNRDKIEKIGPFIFAPSNSMNILEKLNMDIGILANNHILDFQAKGMYDTIDNCQKSGMKTVGAGKNLTDASQPLYIEKNETCLAFLAFAEGEFSSATPTKEGAATFDLLNMHRIIDESKKNADIVIVNVHCGSEWYPIPSPRIQHWYRYLIECGADIVVGHHPHAIQGIEIYKNAPIIYCLGSFLFQESDYKPKCYHASLITKIIVSDGKIAELEIYPCEQIRQSDAPLVNGVRVELMNGGSLSEFKSKYQRICEIAEDPFLVNEFWKCFCEYTKNNYWSILKFHSASLKGDLLDIAKDTINYNRPSYMFHLIGDMFNSIFQRKSTEINSIIRLLNVISCPSHLEVLNTLLEMKASGEILDKEINCEFKKLIEDCKEVS